MSNKISDGDAKTMLGATIIAGHGVGRALGAGLLLAVILPMTSCKFSAPGSSKLAVISLPDNQIRAKHCKGAKPARLARQAVYKIGNTSILSISGSFCDVGKKRLSLADGPSHKTIIITGEPGRQADNQKELVAMYENVDPGLVKVDLSQLPKDADTADVERYIKSQVSSQFPNGYTGDLDVVYNGHGGAPKTVNPPASGPGSDVSDHVTFPQDSGVPMASVLNSAAEGARGGREREGKTIAVVNSCYAGQNKAFIENSASAAAQCQREAFDGIVYPASAEQPLWGPSMIKLNQEYIELRKNGYSKGYDSNQDGRVTLDEFQEGVQPKIGINTQGFADRIAIGAASYIMLDDASKASIYEPEVEVYNGDLVIGDRPVATASW